MVDLEKTSITVIFDKRKIYFFIKYPPDNNTLNKSLLEKVKLVIKLNM